MLYNNRQNKYQVKGLKPLIEETITCILEDEAICHSWQEQDIEVQLAVSFVGPRTIRKFNREFRGVDKSTDVLSFPMLDMTDGKLNEALSQVDFEYSSSQVRVLFIGDILLNINQAYMQAQELGHSSEREIAFLTAHSMFHLLGYDHIDSYQEKTMISKQEKIMQVLNLGR